MIGRTTPTELRISDDEWAIDKSVFFGREIIDDGRITPR